MANSHPSICEDTRRLDEEIQVSDYARGIVLKKLPYGSDHARISESGDAYYFPDKTPEHNQEMIMLACTLLGEEKLPEDKRYALEQLTGELANRLRTIPRPSPDGSNAGKIQHEINHAWELVYHWHHTLLGSGVAQPVSERELYIPAMQAFSSAGNIQRLPHVLGNPKTVEVLFPELTRHNQAKARSRELVLQTFQHSKGEKVREMMAYVLREIPAQSTGDFTDHNKLPEGAFTADHKLFVGFLLIMSTLLGPYAVMGVITAVISDVRNGKKLFESMHDFLVGMQAIPVLDPALDEAEQEAQLRSRLKVVGALCTVLPVIGITLFAAGNQH